MFRVSKGDRSSVQNYLVVFTDGRSNIPVDTWKQAMLARDQGIRIIAVSSILQS